MEDDAFEGLKNLEYLDISDNKVLSLPAAALGRLPSLKRLKADYNRIGALSYEILRSVTGLEELSLAYNIIREIPKGTFKVYAAQQRFFSQMRGITTIFTA